MMIRTLRIENYRCLRDVTLELEPLTVLVGANASGKSSVLTSLAHGFSATDFWSRDPANRIRVAVRDIAGRDAVRSFTGGSSGDGQWPNCQLLQFDLTLLRQPNQLQEMRSINGNGYGLTNVFATLTRKEQEHVAMSFCALVPMFRDAHARPQSGGHHRMVFQDRWNEQVWYEPEQVSDGTVLLLAYLLLPYQSPPPDLIAIEEPERGLHPFLMGELVATLRKLTKGEGGRKPVQVLLATHSAGLLEFVDPSEVRFLHRGKETGETLVRTAPTNDPNWLTVLKAYDNSLGDIWLSGGLGGVPAG